MDNKKQSSREDLYRLKNVFPVKKIAIPMIKGFQNGEPVYEEEPYICYDIDMDAKREALSHID